MKSTSSGTRLLNRMELEKSTEKVFKFRLLTPMIRAPARRADLISSRRGPRPARSSPDCHINASRYGSVSVSRRAQIKRTAEAPMTFASKNLIGIDGKILAKQRNRDVTADFFQIFIAS